MSSNPPGDAGTRFYVLAGEERQSLWPSFTDVPAGWRIVFGEESRDNCLAYMEECLTRPRAAGGRAAEAADAA
ncbi:MbtH family protein [Streptomyces sp. bgisy095]|uniref:MbtH family protein n=1 Tax=unclassified Streptomyces TaxID=2593676 RepID=UPI003D70B18F